ncbi:MAG: hypothetical protein ACFWTY_17785 [Shouchella clausii]
MSEANDEVCERLGVCLQSKGLLGKPFYIEDASPLLSQRAIQ